MRDEVDFDSSGVRPFFYAGEEAIGTGGEQHPGGEVRGGGRRKRELGTSAVRCLLLFTNSGPRGDISAIVRRGSRDGKRGNGQIVRRQAARGG